MRATNAEGTGGWSDSGEGATGGGGGGGGGGTPPPNAVPEFTSDSAPETEENVAAVVTVSATDANREDAVTGYAIVGGALFEIGARSGALAFEFRVRAVNAVGAGAASDPVGAAPRTTASEPRNLRARAAGRGRIDLAWDEPAGDGAAAVTGYLVEVSANDGSIWSDLEADTNSTATTHAHEGLAPDSQWRYRVSAINSAGTGAASEVASATTDGPRGRAGRISEVVLPYATAAMTSSAIGAIGDRIGAAVSGDGRRGRVNLGGFSPLAGNLASLAGDVSSIWAVTSRPSPMG
ncbi:fibronectin type III domain-containing protein [Candidatus Palauibacter sp.]|uniref:fibronectin type III domain-containing protein n=1 Tax=Candidatus Palauibacter sp. TaxID=3101350 RepID=UPI003B5A0A86